MVQGNYRKEHGNREALWRRLRSLNSVELEKYNNGKFYTFR